MSIKIKNPKDREEIFSQLNEMEEEKEELLQESSWEDKEFFGDYEPLCGDNLYEKREGCIICGFNPRKKEINDYCLYDDFYYWEIDSEY